MIRDRYVPVRGTAADAAVGVIMNGQNPAVCGVTHAGPIMPRRDVADRSHLGYYRNHSATPLWPEQAPRCERA